MAGKYLAKSIKHHFGEINLAIQGSHCIIKHHSEFAIGEINLAISTKIANCQI